MQLKISVIIPVFNAESTIRSCVESVLNQSETNFELILVDNNSTDLTSEILLQLKSEDERIVVEREERQGVSFAFNKGLSKAKGTYIARMDADDIMLPGRLKKQAHYLDENSDVGLVSGLVRYIPHKKNTNGFDDYVHWVNSINSDQEIKRNAFVESPVVNPTIMARKSCFENYGTYIQGDFPEDYELVLRWISKGVKMVKLPVEVIEWHDSETRLTRTDERYRMEAFFKTKSSYLAQFILENNPRKHKTWIWGANKLARKRGDLLLKHGLEIEGYIDLEKGKTTVLPCVSYEDLPDCPDRFIVSFIGHWGIRKQIHQFLTDKGWEEGKDFILGA